MGSGGRKLPWGKPKGLSSGAPGDGYPKGARIRAWIDDVRANDDGDGPKRAAAIVALILGYACLLGFPLFFHTNGLVPGILLGAALIVPSGWWFWRKARENKLALADDAPAEMRDHKWRFVAPVSAILAGVGAFAAMGAERPAEPTLLERIVSPDQVPERLKNVPVDAETESGDEVGNQSWLDSLAGTFGLNRNTAPATTAPNSPTATDSPTTDRPAERPTTGEPTTDTPAPGTETSPSETPGDTGTDETTTSPTTPGDATTTEPTTPTEPGGTTTETTDPGDPPHWSDDYMEDAAPDAGTTPSTPTTAATVSRTITPAPTAAETTPATDAPPAAETTEPTVGETE